MTPPPATPAAPAPAADEMDFEKALQRLEAIVRELESGSVPLEAALARFEEGTRLTRLCRERLLAAEAKVQELLADGTVRTIPVDRR